MRDGFVKVAVGTPQVRVADCVYNAEQTIALIKEAAQQGVKLLTMPELGLTGYTCGDLFYQPTLLNGAEAALGQVLEATRELEIVFLVGLPVRVSGKLYNCVAVCQNGLILGLIPKTNVVTSERRHFAVPPVGQSWVQLCCQKTLMRKKAKPTRIVRL